MDYHIVFEAPTFDQVASLIEEMSTDPWVGPMDEGEEARLKWLERQQAMITERHEHNTLSTIILLGSTIVGIAFNKPCTKIQAQVANVNDEAGYYKMGNFYVGKHFRGQGLGKKALMKYIERQSGKVAYFAEIDNLASNKVALDCGLTLSHRALVPKWGGKICRLPKDSDMRIRTPHYAYNVYFFKLPSADQLLTTIE